MKLNIRTYFGAAYIILYPASLSQIDFLSIWQHCRNCSGSYQQPPIFGYPGLPLKISGSSNPGGQHVTVKCLKKKKLKKTAVTYPIGV